MSKLYCKLVALGTMIPALCGVGSVALAATEAMASPVTILASADGQVPGSRVEVTQLKRTSGDTITLNYVVVNDSSKQLDTGNLLKAEKGDRHSGDGVTLIDAAGKKKYLVVRDTDQKCICSSEINDVDSKSSVKLWAKFPAPPVTVQKITIAIPHFQPMDDVPISQ
jgi:hypothetical protein